MRQARSDLVLRKNRRAVWQKLIAATVGAVALGVSIAPVSVQAAVRLSPAMWAVVIVVLVGNGLRSRIILTEHEIIVKGMLVRRRRSRAHAARVVRAVILTPQSSGEALFVLDARGTLLIMVYGEGFTTGDLDRLVDALGLPCSRPDHALTVSELGRMPPGLVPWSWRHGTLLGCAISFVVLAAITGFLVITL
jgi:hypothetical protein